MLGLRLNHVSKRRPRSGPFCHCLLTSCFAVNKPSPGYTIMHLPYYWHTQLSPVMHRNLRGPRSANLVSIGSRRAHFMKNQQWNICSNKIVKISRLLFLLLQWGCEWFNSLRLADVYLRHLYIPSLVQLLAWPLFDSKPLLHIKLACCQLKP